MALANGADAVLELPVPWAVREAEHFALGAVSILHRPGCVTHIAFGAETNDLAALTACAKLLEQPTDELNIQVQAGLRAGLSHPSALSQALAAQCPVSGLEQPNNVLALCYLRALLRLNSNITPILIHRNSSYHATDLSEPFPSATAVRGAVRRGAWAQVREAMPASAYAVLQDAARHGAIYDRSGLTLCCCICFAQLLLKPCVSFPAVSKVWRIVCKVRRKLSARAKSCWLLSRRSAIPMRVYHGSVPH